MTTDKRKALETILEKTEKLFHMMLGSSNPNERTNALERMIVILKGAELDSHDFWQLGWAHNKDDLAGLLAAMLLAKDVDVLVKIGQERATYFSNDAVFADVMVRGHRNTYAVGSRDFTEWLLNEFFNELKKAPAPSSLKSAVRTIAAIAKFGDKTPRYSVQLRTAEVDGRIYIDLSDEQSRCVEVDEGEWRIVEAPSQVRFRRTASMRPLPVPQRGGSLDLLREFTNLDDGAFVLFVAMLLDAFRSGKHPVLNLVGEAGTAKSTLAKLFKQLVDPDETELRSLPRTVRELFIAANSARVRARDNVSKIDWAISDALCQLSDGSGFAARKLYTDDEESRFQGSRTIILTGVDNVVTRSDLSNRVVLLKLQPIKDEVRKSEKEFWARFEQVRPLIFGTLLDALAHGLKQLPNVRLDSKSRMSDFEIFGHACEGAYAETGSFATAWAANATELNEALIEEDCVATAVAAFMENTTECTKTAATWLAELSNRDRTEQKVSQQRDWPKDAARFSKRVRLAEPTLRKAGIEVIFGKASEAETHKDKVAGRAPRARFDVGSRLF